MPLHLLKALDFESHDFFRISELTAQPISLLGISMGVHAGSLHHTAISGLYGRGGIVDFNDIGSEDDDFASAELERNLHL